MNLFYLFHLMSSKSKYSIRNLIQGINKERIKSSNRQLRKICKKIEWSSKVNYLYKKKKLNWWIRLVHSLGSNGNWWLKIESYRTTVLTRVNRDAARRIIGTSTGSAGRRFWKSTKNFPDSIKKSGWSFYLSKNAFTLSWSVSSFCDFFLMLARESAQCSSHRKKKCNLQVLLSN